MSFLNPGKPHNPKDAKSNAMLFVIALICAIACWFIIARKIFPSTSRHLYNIPVSLDVSGTSAAENGLQVLSPEKVTVNVSFDCSSTDFPAMFAPVMSTVSRPKAMLTGWNFRPFCSNVAAISGFVSILRS